MATSTGVTQDAGKLPTAQAQYLAGFGGCCSCALRYPTLRGNLTVTLGCLQITFGVLCITANSVSIHYRDGYGYSQTMGAGIWTGIWFIVSGAFGIAAGKTKTKGMIITCMVMSILSAVLSICTLSLGAWQISESRNYLSWKCDGTDPQWYPKHCEKWRQDLLAAMGSIQVICAILEAVAAIASAVLCCQVVCCRVSEETRAQQFYYDSNRQKIHIQESTTLSSSGLAAPETTDDCCGMRNPRLNAKLTVILGVVQIILGITSIVVNSVSITNAYHEAWDDIITCIVWIGGAFIISGAFGISAGKTQRNCLIIAYMVLSILSTILSICPLVFGVWQIVICADYNLKLLIGLGAVQVICCLLEAGVAIAASVFCCRAVCCYQYKISEQLTNQEDEIIAPSIQASQPSPGYDAFVVGSADPGKCDPIQPSSSTYIDNPPPYEHDIN